ncbi:uncharacterized protein LOC129729080 [Wyeomyia smithii]|uniref:uncharacterized protein LOC129729080 n=1 Tax=Wyeomyia smithii TaxID=174621 RepID=UPI002467BCCE|nr:uncharacterized protein LOC129729080 [Wyeomyia smithii]
MERLELLDPTTNHFETSYQQLITHILSAYFIGVNTICMITNNMRGNLAIIPSGLSFPIVSIDAMHTNGSNMILSVIELGCYNFVVNHEAIERFLDDYIDIHDRATYRNPNKAVIFLLNQPYSSSSTLLNQLSKHSALDEIINLLILLPTDQLRAIDFLTHNYATNSRQTSDLVLLDSYNTYSRKFRYGQNLFPDKISNLQGRAIKVASFAFIPFVAYAEGESSFPTVRSHDRILKLDGLDGHLLRDFCRSYNCTIEMVIDEVNMWGDIYDNRTGQGILGNLVERRADIGLAGLSNWHRYYAYLTYSANIDRGGITVIVPRARTVQSWRTILLVFPKSVWILTAVVFCGLVIISYSLYRPKFGFQNEPDIVWSAFNMLLIFLMRSASVGKRTTSETILSVSLLAFSLLLGNIYISRFSSLITMPPQGTSINTISDLADSNLTLLQVHEAWIFSLLPSTNPAIVKILSRFETYPPEELQRLADKGNVAFCVGRQQNGHLVFGSWITHFNSHKYQLLLEDLYFVFHVAMATKTWPLMEQFNKLTMRTFDAALRYYEELVAYNTYLDPYLNTLFEHARRRTPKQSRAGELNDFIGVFIGFGFGAAFAVIVFVAELLVANFCGPCVLTKKSN